MLKAIISGCNGKMGQVLAGLIENDPGITVSAGFDTLANSKCSFPVYSKHKSCKEEADVIIDFSNSEGLDCLLEYAVSKNIPLVIATTGLSSSQLQKIKKASQYIPIFQSGNMSVGINLVMKLVEETAKVLHENFDIEIIEKHHNQKVDAPSGTALMLAESAKSGLSEKAEYVYNRTNVRKKREKNEIGIHSLRGGTIVGEHSVVFAGNDEIIEINHTALSRNIFGVGAIRAAKFVVTQKPSLYNMKDLISKEGKKSRREIN
ncbi:MAG: 4-hydroxy-tetrahydrodipicolinate reductase [Deltaproteobacteria bacterium]